MTGCDSACDRWICGRAFPAFPARSGPARMGAIGRPRGECVHVLQGPVQGVSQLRGLQQERLEFPLNRAELRMLRAILAMLLDNHPSRDPGIYCQALVVHHAAWRPCGRRISRMRRATTTEPPRKCGTDTVIERGYPGGPHNPDGIPAINRIHPRFPGIGVRGNCIEGPDHFTVRALMRMR